MQERLATFRFFAELTDFVGDPSGRVVRRFTESPSVKDQIEACGVPHTEVDLILANGRSVGFDYRLGDGDHISVYPVFEAFDISSITRVRPEPLRVMRFVADINLGKLAKYLRLLGFDTTGASDDDELVDISVGQRRILLTRDRALLKRAVISHGYLVRQMDPTEQIKEVVRRFDLVRLVEPFGRCMECNGEIDPVDKQEILHLLEPLTRQYFEEFRRCRGCGRIFWQGSHHERLVQIIEAATTG